MARLADAGAYAAATSTFVSSTTRRVTLSPSNRVPVATSIPGSDRVAHSRALWHDRWLAASAKKIYAYVLDKIVALVAGRDNFVGQIDRLRGIEFDGGLVAVTRNPYRSHIWRQFDTCLSPTIVDAELYRYTQRLSLPVTS